MESSSQFSPPNVNGPVLVVDDEPLILWSVSETLRQQGYAVVEARDARGALDAVAAAPSPFGVVVLDLRLPDCHDLSLLSRVHSMLVHAQIIVVTAHGTGELERAAQDLGAYCVMHKPFGMTELVEKVREASHDCLHDTPEDSRH